MKRQDLEALGLDSEQIEAIMKANGLDIQAEKDKAKAATDEAAEAASAQLAAQIAELENQIAGYQTTIKDSENVPKALEAKIKQLEIDSQTALDALKSEHAQTETALRRENRATEFLSGLDRKLINAETRKAIHANIVEGLGDTKYEGMSIRDIFEDVTRGEDGNPRADIYAPEGTNTTKAPDVAGKTNAPPDTAKIESLRDALAEKYAT